MKYCHNKSDTSLDETRSTSARRRCIGILAGAALGILTFTATVAFSQDGDGIPGREFWTDPAFVESFMGTYGFATDIEPTITRDEQNFLAELIELIQEDPRLAIERLEAALTADSSAALDFVLGNLYFQLDETDEAALHYETALDKFPNFMRAHKNLAMIRVREGEFSAAARGFTRTIELGGFDGNTYGLLGLSYLNIERFHSAESAYRQALLHDPENLQWRLGAAQVLLAQDRYGEANSILEELITDAPERPEYYLYQANAFLGMDQPRRAAVNYELVRRLNGATAQSLATLGDIYLSEELPGLATEVYLEAIDRDPPVQISRAVRAARNMTGRYAWDEASTLLAEIERRYEADALEDVGLELTRLRARIQLHAGDEDEAIRLLERVVEEDPLDGASLILLARHYGEQGDRERAELLFERAARAPGNEAEAYLRHAEFLVRENHLERAAELLRRSQQIRPRENVARYLERIVDILRGR